MEIGLLTYVNIIVHLCPLVHITYVQETQQRSPPTGAGRWYFETHPGEEEAPLDRPSFGVSVVTAEISMKQTAEKGLLLGLLVEHVEHWTLNIDLGEVAVGDDFFIHFGAPRQQTAAKAIACSPMN